ncbi:GPW/gp25 family protein [Limnobaculum xujianqingii]|uniref:GPW/gp25 family protein n=1 Tax=Limnobaculum xujianqingii TaxID=2738837 RepID=UPI00112A4907|nr:GPW/gp25 family protein [Limnobaculum xujianqingii]
MSQERYAGMNASTGRMITDAEHIQQSISDILTTPIGSRLMRRNYGARLQELIDQPANPVTVLKIMSAIYSALYQWEPRVSLTNININIDDKGQYIALMTFRRTDDLSTFMTDVNLRMAK